MPEDRILNEKLDNLLEAFANVSEEEKKDFIINELKLLLSVIEKLKNELNFEDDLLLSKYLITNPLKNNEDNSLIKICAYVKIIQESFASLVDGVTEVLKKEEEI